MALDTTLGWSDGDDVRVLTAAQLPVSIYAIQQIQEDMNYLGEASETLLQSVLQLLDEYEAALALNISLNTTSEGKTLIKADVLEWQVGGAAIEYSPTAELQRIRDQMRLYFSSSRLVAGATTGSRLYRS